MRKLASIKKIDNITPIEGADKIVVAHIGGWKIIVKKEEFRVNDLAVYFEIDSFLPIRPEFEFLRSKCLKVMDNQEGFRLKSMKMRGVTSQGLLLPLTTFPEIQNVEEGMDVSILLNVQLYEAPVHENGAKLGGKPKGNFPYFFPKTDEERIQNLHISQILGRELEASEKLDGSSMSVFFNDGHFGVCSRNLELTEDDTNAFWAMANKLNLKDQLTSLGLNIAIQGELVGPGIQGNKYKLTEHEFRVFKIWNIDEQKMLTSSARRKLIDEHLIGIKHVPIIVDNIVFDNIDRDFLIRFAEGKSILNETVEREGLVFKETNDSGFSFKAISNKFLLKHDL